MDGKQLGSELERLLLSALPHLVREESAAERGRLYRAVMARLELPLLRHVLDLSGGNQLKAARLLGINRNTLRKRLRVLGLLPQAPSRNGSAA
jgi:two-component system, NtrC family, nitrogen regulation response regulator GlnG